MLPLPNLDDRSFEELVREARDLIPGILADWTDENAHDPGITLLEMLAWHIEMQQFRLDRLTVSHERKFLKLLGEQPRDRTPAMTSVSFSNAARPMLLPTGTLLRVGELPFETIRPVTVLPDMLKQVYVHTSEGELAVTDDLELGSAPFYPFGEEGEIGASMLIVFGEPLPLQTPLSLWFELTDQEPTVRIPPRYKHFVPSSTTVWSYWLEQADGSGSWEPLPLERDESYSFHQSGPILFQLPQTEGQATKLRVEMTGGEYHDPPRIRRLIWNEVFAEQGESLCYAKTFAASDLESEEATGKLVAPLTHALFQQGRLTLQRTEDGTLWRDIAPGTYDLNLRDNQAVLHIDSELAVSEAGGVRLIAVSDGFLDHWLLGSGTGISGQRLPLPVEDVMADRLLLQVGYWNPEEGEMIWTDWERKPDFDESGPDSRHYVVDVQDGVLLFSDGEHGMVPPASALPNIRLIGCRTGIGEGGNVKENIVQKIELHGQVLHVTNLYPAYGGAEAETMKEAMLRTRLSLLQPKCGITAEDLEARVYEIPGLRIAKVKTIPGYYPKLARYPEERAVGKISIVVVPYSKKQLPKPSEGFIETIGRHLEPYRLLTTDFHIIPPEYVKVTVRATIVVDLRYQGRDHAVGEALTRWLQPYGDTHTSGWTFGHPIYKSDIYDIIHQVPGVHYIQDLWLMAEGRDVHTDEGGDIRIPPNALVISGEHDIDFITTMG
ncbi:putative baseplate assembly protein [Paenibacillus daejeonensis]|uniref:putative baseplate assembly protein n=1 Tax=Paenibacillus daejeonensis TaxID=135193 RepID=UPI00037E61D5|nr:putative baseplate assembly protein [Paenibacillus daejeonensis]